VRLPFFYLVNAAVSCRSYVQAIAMDRDRIVTGDAHGQVHVTDRDHLVKRRALEEQRDWVMSLSLRDGCVRVLLLGLLLLRTFCASVALSAVVFALLVGGFVVCVDCGLMFGAGCWRPHPSREKYWCTKSSDFFAADRQ